MVERCCSPAPFGESSLLRRITSDRLAELCSSEEGNRQLALLLIKKEPQETDCNEYSPGYFLLKQEGAEPILVRKEPFKDTMERVMIPPTLQTVSRCNGTSKEISSSNTSSETTVSCQRIASSSSTQTTSTSGFKGSDTEGATHSASANTKLVNSAQPLPTVTLSSQAVLPSRSSQMSVPRAQQIVAPVQAVEPIEPNVQLRTTQAQQNVQQNVQHSVAVPNFGSKQFQPSCPQHKNPVKESCASIQPFHIPVTARDNRVLPVPIGKSVAPLPEVSIQPTKPLIASHQTGTSPAQNMTVLGPIPGPRGQVSFPPGLHSVASGQVHISRPQIPPPPNQGTVPPPQVLVPPMHHTVPPTYVSVPSTQALVQPNQMHPHNSQSLNVQSHVPPVPHNNLPASSQPHYLTQVPFAAPFNPVQSMKPSVTATSVPQPNAPAPIEHTASHYEMLSDPLCSSSDQFFPVPDNTSDLLQSFASMPFHQPIVLTQQEPTTVVPSQSSGQPLQLAPLLTLKEQQVANGNQGNVAKRIQTTQADIAMSAVNNFEEHMPRFPPLASPHMNSHGAESMAVEMHVEDPIENNGDSSPVLMPCPREQQYTVLSKPGPNFIISDSTKDQLFFRMNMMKDSVIDSDINKQRQGCDTTCQTWETSDLASMIPQMALSIPAHNLLQKSARKVLEKKTECSECGRILSNASSLENHMRLHRGERPYTCSQCGKAFPSVRGLNRHVKVHAEEKGYKCEECGRSFVYQFTLTKHKLIHSGDRPFPCKVCGKKFLAKADRATHMRMHTGEKPFFCNQCGKTFKHRVALNMHMQGHRGEKRYVCPHCEKGFVDLGNFKRHKRIHTGEKPFECKECGKRFTQSAHLKKHVNTQHMVHKPKPISLPSNEVPP